MDDIFEEENLLKHGYKISPFGAAYSDLQGNYLESITIDGQTKSSLIDKKEYTRLYDEHYNLQNSGYKFDPYSGVPESNQKQQGLAKMYAEEFRKDAANAVIPIEVKESEEFKETFKEESKLKEEQGEKVYPTVEAQEEAAEKGTMYESFTEEDMSKEDKSDLKSLMAQKEKLLEEDPDFDAESAQSIEDRNKEAEQYGKYNPIQVFAGLQNIIDSAIAQVVPTGTGMKSEENKLKLEELNKEIASKKRGFVANSKQRLKGSIADIEQRREELNTLAHPQKSTRLDYAQKILEETLWTLEDHENNSWMPQTVFSMYNAIDQGTRGIVGLVSEVPTILHLKYDATNDNDIDESQFLVADALRMRQKVTNANLNQSDAHKFIIGINESLKFVGFSKVGRNAGTTVANNLLAKGLPKVTTKLGKKAVKWGSDLAGFGTQLVMHPSTYYSSADRYAGDITLDEEGNIITDLKTTRTLLRELNESLELIADEQSKGENSVYDKTQLDINKGIIEDAIEKAKANAPAGLVEAFAYGLTETGKELFFETQLTKGLNFLGSKLKKIPSLSKLGKNIDDISAVSKSKGAMDAQRRFAGVSNTGTRVIGNLLEEDLEEVAVQLTPTIGELNWEDYKRQASEVLTFDFHAKVLAQTFVMNKGFQALGKTNEFLDDHSWRNNFTAMIAAGKKGVTKFDYVAERKAAYDRKVFLKTSFTKLGDASSRVIAEDILMKTGEGTITIQDYHNKISELNRAGDPIGAMELKRDLLRKQAIHAANSGATKEFSLALKKLSLNTKVDGQTRQLAKDMLEEANDIQNDVSTYPNSEEILDYKSKLKYSSKTLEEVEMAQLKVQFDDMYENTRNLEEELAKEDLTLQDFSSNEKVEDFDAKVNRVVENLSEHEIQFLKLETVKTTLKNSQKQVNKLLKDATSPETQAIIHERGKYFKTIDEVNRRYFNGKMTASEFKKLVAPTLEKRGVSGILKGGKLVEINNNIYKAKKKGEIQAQAIKSQRTKLRKQAEQEAKDLAQPVEEKIEIVNDVIEEQRENLKKAQEENDVEGIKKATDLLEYWAIEVAKLEKEGSTPAEVETKKAKIEAERQAELKRMTFNELFELFKGHQVGLIGNKKELEGDTFRIIDTVKEGKEVVIERQKPDGTISSFGIPVGKDFKKFEEKYKDVELSIEDINKKYDAEVATLESQPTQQTSEVKVTPAESIVQPVEQKTDEQKKYEASLNKTAEVIDTVISQEADSKIQVNDKDEIDFNDIQDFDLPIEQEHEETVEALKLFAQEYEAVYKVKPTFKDWWEATIEAEDGNIYVFDKNLLEWTAAQWNFAKLGNSNWQKVWKDNYTNNSKIRVRFKSIREAYRSNEELAKVNTEIVKTPIVTSNTPKSPATGNPMALVSGDVTPNVGKTMTTNVKGNFSAIKYQNEKEESGEITVYTKEDKNKEIPQLNENTPLEIKELLHPDNLNPGDKVNIRVIDESEWSTILVNIYNDKGIIDKRISFQEWYDTNSKEWLKDNKGSTLEDFQNSELFISRIPMFYTNPATNNDVMFVADTAWYNQYSMGDPDTDNKVIDLNNPSSTVQESVKLGKKNALQLRQDVIIGEVTEGIIETKTSGFAQKIPGNLPVKTLWEVARDNQIVLFDGSDFVDLEGNTINTNTHVILNMDKVLENFQNAGFNNGTKSTMQSMYLSPDHKTTENGEVIQHYKAFMVLRTDEGGREKQAMREDVETAKLILSAHEALTTKETVNGITYEKALELRDMLLDNSDVALNIAEAEDAYGMVRGLVALETTNGLIDYPSSGGNKKYKSFLTKLLEDKLKVIQNTSKDVPTARGISIKNNDGTFKVEVKPYVDFLKTRLSTNIMSYNMGTEENWASTHNIQPIIKINPVRSEEVKSIQENQQVVNETPTETKVEDIKEDVAKARELEQLKELDKEKDSFLASINALNETTPSTDELSDESLPEMDDVTLIRDSLKTIGDLAAKDQRDIIQFLRDSLSLVVGVSKKDYKRAANKFFKDTYVPTLEKCKEYIEKYEGFHKTFPDDKGVQATLSTLRSQEINFENILKNEEAFFDKAYEEGLKKGNIKDLEDTDDTIKKEDLDHNEEESLTRNFYRSSNEDIHKEKIGAKLKRVFTGIPTGEKGFMGTPLYEDFDMIYNFIATYISSPLPTDPSFNEMVKRLKLIEAKVPWMKEVIKRLEESPQDTKASFVSNMYKYSANAKFVMFNKNKEKGIESSLWFSNRNNHIRKIKESWNENFKRSKIVKGNVLDKKILRGLAEQYESWNPQNKHSESDEVLKDWLAAFGLEFSDGTWEDIKLGKLVLTHKSGSKPISFENLFKPTSKGRNYQLFDSLYKYARDNSKKEGDLDFTENAKLYPLEDLSTTIKGLLDLEVLYNTSTKSITRRDGGKTVSELVYPSFFLDTMRNLISSANDTEGGHQYIKDLMNIPFSENSMILELLLKNKNFKDIFSYGEVGLMSLRNQYEKPNDYAKIEDLSPIDYVFHQMAMFQDMKNEEISATRKGFKMRVGTVSTPTSSDKGRMMLLKTAVYDFFKTDLAFEGDDFKFTKRLKEVLYADLIEPELNRKVQHTTQDVKKYNIGAMRFNNMPSLNYMVNSEGLTVEKFFENIEVRTEKGENLSSEEIKAEFKLQFFTEATNILEQSINSEVNSELKDIQEFEASNDINSSKDGINSTTYLNRKDPLNESDSAMQKKRRAMLDYVINSNISNMNIMQTISGDPAVYYNSKVTPSIKETHDLSSKELGVNMGKRLALMIAPGVALSNSHNEQYIQIMLKDNDIVAPNIELIAGYHYGKSILKKTYEKETYKVIMDKIATGEYKNDSPQYEEIKKKLPKIAPFLSIENTDAQEYTTLAEHLRVLKGLGRINKEQEKNILDNKDNLSEADMSLILQPMKPVYTGEIIERDEKGKVMFKRMVYIKSSSFPLIPELINGTPLEGLMNTMNEIEKKQTKFNGGKYVGVRASYGSANKLGSTEREINPTSETDLATLLQSREDGKAPKRSALLLNRSGFKIQQDVPNKSAKNGSDQVSMGTQIFKLLFGDGLAQHSTKEFDGPQLLEDFHRAFSKMININKDALVEELGLDENYQPKDKEQYMEKVKALLLREAKERNFSENDMKSFDIDSRKNSKTGETIYYFKQPLWLSGNSNKIEAMFNAIINNKIFKQKLPGNSFVVASNNGITLQTQENFDKKNNSIVYLGDYKGGELQGNEVLAPSRIKLNGTLIDLFEVSESGNYKYVIKDKDGSFTINEKAIDPALFENFVFRTPTSSHGSGSGIKIVGFIPAVLGDLMITPSNFVTQMGQDFDVDKLTAYQYHHVYNEKTKRIEIFNKGHKEARLRSFRNKLSEIDNKIKKEDELSKEEKDSVNNFLKALLADFKSFDNAEEAITQVDEVVDKILEDEEITLAKKRDSLLEKLRTMPAKLDMKLAQNMFIGIHNKIYNSTDPFIQAKINKVLSMDTATEQAENIDNKVSSSKIVNLTSPKYQREKLISGSTGNSAIGVYAKGMTLNSLIQQQKEGDKLEILNAEGEKKVRFIGDLKTEGEFGLLQNLTISPKKENGERIEATEVEKYFTRPLVESLDERVNTATDNEKAQILGRVGITNIKNVAVDNFLALQGIDVEVRELDIDKGEYEEANPFHKIGYLPGTTEPVYYSEHSIPYLLHSQPIIKEYFKRLKNGRAQAGNLTKDLEKTILAELMGDYKIQPKFSENFTGKKLFNSLSNNIDSEFQKEVLFLYADLMKDADKVKEIQSSIDLSNLGKSMWEAKDKIEKFKDLATNKDFKNLSNLIGDFNYKGEGVYLGDINIGDVKNTKIEGLYFKPTTNQGIMVSTAVSLARNLFLNNFFPYYDSAIEIAMQDIITVSGKKDTPQFREEVFNNIKQFITSSDSNGIFLDTTKNVREDLLFEKDGPSLSTYVADTLGVTDKEYSKGINLLGKNILITSFSYEKGVNGKPSLIKYDNTAAGNTNEEDFHVAMKELLVSDSPLPPRNGRPYTTRMLAQDLVSYSYVSGGIISEAIQFHKFIPLEYFDQITVKQVYKGGRVIEMPVTKKMQGYDTRIMNWSDMGILGNFTTQFIQNNPTFSRALSKEDIKSLNYLDKTKRSFEYFVKEGEILPEFVRLSGNSRAKNKQGKTSLYKLVFGNTYEQIDVLGEFGMTEYSAKESDLKTSIGVATPRKVFTKKNGGFTYTQPKTAPFEANTGDSVLTLLKKVKADNASSNPNLSEIASTLIDLFGDKAMELQIKVEEDLGPAGVYSPSNNTITLKKGSKNLGETFVHEFIHGVTSKYLNPYINHTTGQLKTDIEIPKDIQEINSVFLETRNYIIDTYKEEYDNFMFKWETYKDAKKNKEASGVIFTPRERNLFYSTVNLKEYLAISLGNNQLLLEETSKVPYKSTKITLSEKLMKVLNRIFESMAGKENSLAEQIIGKNLDFIQKRANTLEKSSEKLPSELDIQRDLGSSPNLDNYYNGNAPPLDQYGDLFGNDQDISFEKLVETVMLPLGTKPCK